MAPMFYKNAAAIIVCYDVTDRQSFEGMRIWLDEVRRKVKIDDEVVVAIAALKTDLLQDNNGTNNRIEPAVPEYEVEQLAEALGVIYLPTSAKADMNVNALFQCVSDRVLHHRSTNNNNSNMNTFGGGGGATYGNNNNDILINRDDLNSSPIPSSTQPRLRDQYDKYYKKNSETSQESSQMNGNDESINSMANSRVRTNSGGSGIGKLDSTPGRVPTPNSDGTTSINNVGDDSIIASPSPGKKRRGKYDKDTSPNKNKGNDKGLCPGGECADENLYTCSPMTCGVGSTGDGSSSGCIVQ